MNIESVTTILITAISVLGVVWAVVQREKDAAHARIDRCERRLQKENERNEKKFEEITHELQNKVQVGQMNRIEDRLSSEHLKLATKFDQMQDGFTKRFDNLVALISKNSGSS